MWKYHKKPDTCWYRHHLIFFCYSLFQAVEMEEVLQALAIDIPKRTEIEAPSMSDIGVPKGNQESYLRNQANPIWPEIIF
jgi:hypothetical protein